MKLKQFIFTFLSGCVAMVSGTQVAQAASFEILASNLNNPRGLSFGADGSIYVGETGTGGNGKCQPSPSTMFAEICAGNTGSVTKIGIDGTVSRVVNNFDSLALQPTQEQGAGPQQLQFDSEGNAYLLTGYAGFPGNRDLELNQLSQGLELPPDQAFIAPPSDPEDVLGADNLAKLFRVDLATQELTEIFDFGEYEILNNVDGGDFITNPYDLEIANNRAYVVDAGANVIYDFSLDGTDVNAVASLTQLVEDVEFPPGTMIPPEELPEGNPGGMSPDVRDSEPLPGTILPTTLELQSVPTGATIGPDGAYYFGELTGFPYPEGEARVFRLNEEGVPEVFAEGFTQIADIVFDQDGNLLVLQFADLAQWRESVNGSLAGLPGSILQVTPEGMISTLLDENIFSATGIEVDNNGDIILVNNGVGTQGEVVRVTMTPPPGIEPESVPEPTSVLSLVAFGVGSRFLFKGKNKQVSDKDSA
ncbi:ScyD/ScyE family protein [Cyanothece sp. BG0011]|uniref:ScyD/ScyE family protein n=1 Tax=Cyanothece sp. BG0011 TaxID=2082950 RepID=UPI000D1F1038|nr:ScyD/ScyE family protein [Cyanothece sp. BG0011]